MKELMPNTKDRIGMSGKPQIKTGSLTKIINMKNRHGREMTGIRIIIPNTTRNTMETVNTLNTPDTDVFIRGSITIR